MEEEVKKWLRKKLEESSRKEENKPQMPVEIPLKKDEQLNKLSKEEPVQKFFETQKIIEKPEKNVIVQKQPQPIQRLQKPFPIVRNEEPRPLQPVQKYQITKPEKNYDQSPENIPMTKKPRVSKKVLIGIAAIFGITLVAAVVFFFIIPNFNFSPIVIAPLATSSQEKHQYKISLMHNGNPLETESSAFVDNVVFGISLINKTSICSQDYYSNPVSSPTYTFDTNTKISEKSLNDFEKEEYAFVLSASLNFNETNKEVVAEQALFSTDASSFYNSLPKLSKDFSINFDMPFFDKSTEKVFIYGKDLSFHIEMADNWNENAKTYCFFIRRYDASIDSNLQICQFSPNNENPPCTNIRGKECGQKQSVYYTASTSRNGKSIDCTIPLSELTTEKQYSIFIRMLEPMTGSLYKAYSFITNKYILSNNTVTSV